MSRREPRTGSPDKRPKHHHTWLAGPVPRPLSPKPEWWWIHGNGDPGSQTWCESVVATETPSVTTHSPERDDRTLSPTPPLPSTLPPTMPGPSHNKVVSVAIYPDKDSPLLLCVDGQQRC